MAGQRKLMSEIDRTLKKVTEGVEVFNDIWDKVYAATAQNQKEKHEADLKKEIKKLQRFRDQIKNWIGNSDVKDKKPLLDARRLIEQKMEEFKVCEKETKTKAYSKEGLAQTERLDPSEMARQKTTSWIQDALTQLNEQIETVECDLERLQQSKGKNRNKQEIEALEKMLAKHKWHVLKLEQINRLLDNDALEPSQVDELKEDIDYYLEANAEPDFMDTYGDDDIYETLDLDSLGAAVQVALPTEQDVGLEEPPNSSPVLDHSTSATVISSNSSRTKTPKKSMSASNVMAGIGRPNAVKPVELKTSASLSTPVRSSTAANGNSTALAVTPGGKSDSSEKNEDKSKAVRGTPQRAKAGLPLPHSAEKDTPAKPGPGSTASSSSAPSPVVAEKAVDRKQQSPVPQRSTTSSPGVVGTMDAKRNTPVGKAVTPPPVSTATPTTASSSSASSLGASNAAPQSAPVAQEPTLTEEQKQILRLIDESFHFIPENRDSEKPNRYVPRNLYPTPAAFPSTPSTIFDNAQVFEKLDVDTLFFIFYYQQSSYQQYLAARELKRRTWGYHKKYKTWFKRHEEPQVTGEDYEQGTFVYFDYETGWCQRIKTEFTFEYSYLEDELV